VFDRITINRQGLDGDPIDLGFLAECLVFYRKVRVVADPEIFRFLVQRCGAEELLEALTMGDLEIEFFENTTGVRTVDTNIGQLHELVMFTAEPMHYLQVSRKLIDEICGPSGKGTARLFNRFQKLVVRTNYEKEDSAAAREDWIHRPYVSSAVRSLLSLLAPDYKVPDPLVFEVEPVPAAAHTGGAFKVVTNIDFEAANLSYHSRIPKEHSSLSPAYLLILIANARRDITVGSRHESEFAVAPMIGVIAACKFSEIISTAHPGIQAADIFQEAVVQGMPKIREAVNAGEKTFGDVIRLVERAQRFKDWLRNHQAGEELRAEYCRDVARAEWTDKLPSKSLRWLLVNMAGTALGAIPGHPIAGAVVANALSAADCFLLDKILKGWRPNQFVDGPLREFLRS
jgi:hypothetical protein